MTAWPFTVRRTVYSFIDRTHVPGDFLSFDFASPDTHASGRYLTTVPQQALFLMNSPFVIEQAQRLIARPEIAAAKTTRQKIEAIYRAVYARRPSMDEAQLGLQFVVAQPAITLHALVPMGKDEPHAKAQTLTDRQSQTAAWQYGQGEYDEKAGRLKSFVAYSSFVEGAWRGSPMVGDPRQSTARLTEVGGLTGRSPQVMAMRRWTAPFDGRVAIKGEFIHDNDNACAECDGVQGWIVINSVKALGEWKAQLSRAETNCDSIEVRAGDTIDFIVDGRSRHDDDEFKWPVKIARVGMNETWDSTADFLRPAPRPMNAWERYAQVLLSSVEFLLVD